MVVGLKLVKTIIRYYDDIPCEFGGHRACGKSGAALPLQTPVIAKISVKLGRYSFLVESVPKNHIVALFTPTRLDKKQGLQLVC